MNNAGFEPYKSLDIDNLLNLLTHPANAPDVHQGAFDAMLDLDPDDRREGLVTVMHSVVKNPKNYNPDLVISIIEIFATDPDPDSTDALLELLPGILEGSLTSNSLPMDVRQFFYEATATRTRDEDLAVWESKIGSFSGRALIGALVDKTAKPLDIIEPMTLLERRPEPERTLSMMSLLTYFAQQGRGTEARAVAEKVAATHDETAFAKALKGVTEYWDKARQVAGKEKYASILEAALSILDTKPRTAMEKLSGKRPWAK